MVDFEEGTPLKYAKTSINEMYFQRFLQTVALFDNVLANPTSTTDRRPRILARTVVNKILDPVKKHRLLDEYDRQLDIIAKSGKSNEDKYEDVLILANFLVGEACEWCDDALNVIKINEIADV